MSITSPTSRPVRYLLYVWAAPATAIGCCLAVFALCLGATWRMVAGVIEVGGGRFASLVRLLPRSMRFEAITFGHMVLGLNHTVLATYRLHEHAHVRQYERWGLLFFPLYLGSSLVQLLRGRARVIRIISRGKRIGMLHPRPLWMIHTTANPE